MSQHNLSPEDKFNANLVQIIMLLFKKGFISNADVQTEIKVGFKKASKYMDKLVDYRLIPPAGRWQEAQKSNCGGC